MNYLEQPQNAFYLGNQHMENAFLIAPKSLYPKSQNIPFEGCEYCFYLFLLDFLNRLCFF